MTEGIEIRGGAGEFEAAVIAIVLDHIDREVAQAQQRTRTSLTGLPAWVRANSQLTPDQAPPAVRPDRR
jgi:hypothetical protein